MPYNYSEEENKILKFWEDNKIFEKSLEQTKKGKPFVFYDGPPFATGLPHYGHLLQSVIKDAIPRYKTMQGFYVQRQWGWDCHGLPIENIVEKELGTKTKKEIIEMGVKKFNNLCREKIFTFMHEWEKIIPRFGRWADMSNPYKTMDFEYMQAEWWAFKELYKKGLIYEDYRSMHICPRCETTLSQGEVTEGYKNIKDLSAVVKFKVLNEENVYLLAWTTTPWTLPGNVALAVGENIEYVKVKVGEDIFVLAKNRLATVMRDKHYEVKEALKGKKLIGLKYKALFDDFNKDGELKNRENGWKVYGADFVTTEDGTGIVHIAPAFGTDDMELGKRENLPFVQHVKMDGTFAQDKGEFSGLDLKPRAKDKPEEIREADLTVVKYLEKIGFLFNYEKYEHSYPHCWRCDAALLNYATSSWFVAVEKIKPKLLKTAKKINWSPKHIKEGRFGQWLQGARDWSISRQRFWANTIPVWRCDKCKKEIVFGSAEELERASGIKVNDLHKDIIDDVTFKCNCNGNMKRISDVLDTWFDSGSVPFATKRPIPADFIGEAQDQTRAWFYYQHVLAGALFNKEAFKNCIVTGIVLAEDGKKMSKKLKNYPDPTEIMEKYGADAMRFYMLNSPVVQAESLSFSEKGVDEIAKKNIGRLYNVLEFYKLYENGTPASNVSKNILDIWILSRLGELIKSTTNGYENYSLDLAVRPLINFIDDCSVWYLRRSRDRFKDEGMGKTEALATLRYILYSLSIAIAPVMPFFAEYIFQAVREKTDKESVHLMLWPKADKKAMNEELTAQMQEVRDIVARAMAERVEKSIKVKQPLSSLKIKNIESKLNGKKDLLELVKDEINIKEIIFDNKIEKEIELDTNLTEELKEEGILREIVRQIQVQRKEEKLVPQDKIELIILAPEKEKSIIEKNKESLLRECKAIKINVELGENLSIKVKKV